MTLSNMTVRSHQDDNTLWDTTDEVAQLKLSPEALLNVWCGKEAGKARNRDIPIPDAPILPTERWALFSHGALTKKITGQLDAGIMQQLSRQSKEAYIFKKNINYLQVRSNRSSQLACKTTSTN
jgi:hypothetical protein